jgi:predicted GTPase
VHILNDFFLLAWNEDAKLIDDIDYKTKSKISELFAENRDDFCDSCSILLIISQENLEKIVNISEIKSIFNDIFLDKTIEKYTILQAQKELLSFLVNLGDIPLNKEIKNRFEKLRKEGVISYYISRRLIGLVALIKEKKIKKVQIKLKDSTKDNLFYKNSLNILNASIENLKQCVESQMYLERIDTIAQKLKNEKFSIGITGIMNAGKSTMLNALLGKEILGTSVVPETANLTILKYSKKQYAKVNYWNRDEFKKIEDSGANIKSIDKFIKQTKEHFGAELGQYITDNGKQEKVEIENLGLYTSVKKSNMRCNLVKSVELYSDLKFLKDGVEIVDTPGLDDPIVEREEITLEYVSDCDLMVHLMNVNQSATKKDVDFIINSVIYQNISRLLVVITRIDTVSEKELQEVIEYTKQSIKNRLNEQNRSNKLDIILGKIDFIPISGKVAFLQKTGKFDEINKLGFDVGKSGIEEIEHYLNRVLFGAESEKARLIISNNLSELKNISMHSFNLFEEEESFLNKSNEEIQKDYEIFKTQKISFAKSVKKVKDAICKAEDELKSYFKILEKFTDERFVNLKDIIKSRILDDVSYEVRKNKKLPKKERLAYMIEVGIKDGLIDLLRDYRYEFQKKMQTVSEDVKLSFEKLESIKEHKDLLRYDNDKFDSRDFFDQNFKEFLVFKNADALHVKTNEAIKKYAKKSLEDLERALDLLFQDEIENLKLMMQKKLIGINTELLENFIKLSRDKVGLIEADIQIKDNMIEKSMQTIKQTTTDKLQRLETIKSKKEALKKIDEQLVAVQGEVK